MNITDPSPDSELSRAVAALAACIEHSGGGVVAICVNATGWPRSAAVLPASARDVPPSPPNA